MIALPEPLANLPRSARRTLGKILGELFEVIALTLPGQVAVARMTTINGQPAYQSLFMPVECLEPYGEEEH